MQDQDKTPEQLIHELEGLRQRIAALEQSELEFRRTRHALQEANERLDLALKAGMCGLWEYNVQTGEALFSKHRAEMLGYALEELEPHISGWGRLVHPEDVPRVIDAINKHLEGRSDHYECRHRLQAKSGEWRWVLARGRVVEFDVSGKPLRFAGTSVDITDRKLAEEALKKAHEELEQRVTERTLELTRINEALLRENAERKRAETSLELERKQLLAIFDSIDEVISVIDAQTYEILFVNRFVRERYGKDLVGGYCFRELHGLESPCAHCRRDAALSLCGEPFRWDYHNPTTNKDYLATDTIITWSDGRKAKFHLGIDVSERRKAMEALTQSEQRYRRLFENAPLMYIITRNEGGIPFIADCNELFLQSAGYERQDVVGKPLGDFYSPRSQFELLEGGGYARALTGEFFIGERELVTRDGRIIPTLLYTATELDSAGQVIGTRAMFVDITELKRAEEALRESEQRFKQVAENADEWIWEVDESGLYQYCSSAVENILGYSPEELVGQKHFYDLFSPDLREELKREVLEAFQRREPFRNFVNRNLHKGGSIVFLETNGTPVQDENGAFVGYRGVDKDITHRKLAEEELQAANAYNRSLFEASLDPLVTINAQGRITDVNGAMEHASGHLRDELIGSDFANYFTHPLKAAGVYRDAFREGSTRDRELEIRHRDGHVTPMVYNASVYYDSQGRIAGLLAAARDITERKLSEDLIRIRLRLLEYSATHTLHEILQKTLDEIGSLTKSPIGFYHFVSEDEKNISLQVWSTKTVQKFCRAEGTGRHYPVSEAGVWADAVRERRPVIHNDYASLPHRKGMPEGHAPVVRELVVPIIKSDRIVAVLGIGNKPTTYTDKDAEVVSYLADVAWEIARRKRVEEAIRKSEERLELALHGADLGLWDLNIPTGEAVANQRTAEIVGYSLDEIEQTLSSWERFLHPDDRQRALDAFYNHLAGLTSFAEEEYRVRHKSGEWKWVLSRGKVTERDQEGNPLRMSGTYLDITEKKVAETQVSEANELREKIVSESPVGIAVYRGDGQCISANEALGRILGSSREGLLLQNFRDLASWKDTGLLADAEKVLSEGMNNQREVQFVSTFGKPVWVNARMARLNLGGQPHLLMVLNDIAERRKAQDALKFEREQLLSLFESINEVILVIDPQSYEILYANSFTEDLYGKKLVGGKCYERLQGFPAPCNHCHNEKISRLGGHPYQWEYSNEVLKRDFLATDRMIRWPDGRDVKFQLAIDITERKEAEAEQAHLRAQLFQAQKMEAIGTLAGGVSHDFNNILQVALGYSELILGDEELPAGVRTDLRHINESAKRGADLVQRLLTFSRKAESKPQPLNLNRQINDIWKMLERTIPKVIEIQLLLARNLPTINADPTQMDQILMNLAVNARDAMPHGGRLIFETADVLLDEEFVALHPGIAPGRYVLLRVTDTGTGMARETLEHVFEPFFTTKRVGEGTGLGLAVVYGIVHQHGGFITCSSEFGAGTAFAVYLPVLRAEATTETAAEKVLLPGGTETILLVDDEETVQDLGRRILERSGYTVLIAANGKEALDLYKRERDTIALVILDVIMPEMDGKQCLEELLKIDPRVKTLIASGLAANSEALEAVKKLAQGCIGKPYQRTQLLQSVREIVDAE
jgi:PAS domain S-box-containing protein